VTSICLINQKGGCGKSSTCLHLAGALAAAGNSVLLVDADPQGSATQGFLGSALVETLELRETVAGLLDDHVFLSDPRLIVRKTTFKGIALMPANQLLAPFNRPCPETTGMRQYALRTALQALDAFDFVLIDCPPNLYMCSWAAMIAADYVIVPVPPEDFGTQGLRAVHQAIDHARRLNPGLRRLGHLVTRCDRRLLIHRAYEERLRSLYPHMVLDTVIPEASAFKVSVAARQPVEFYAPKSQAAVLTRRLAAEIIDRIEARSAGERAA